MSNLVETKDAMESAKRHTDGIHELVCLMQESKTYPRDSFNILAMAADRVSEEIETALNLIEQAEN